MLTILQRSVGVAATILALVVCACGTNGSTVPISQQSRSSTLEAERAAAAAISPQISGRERQVIFKMLVALASHHKTPLSSTARVILVRANANGTSEVFVNRPELRGIVEKFDRPVGASYAVNSRGRRIAIPILAPPGQQIVPLSSIPSAPPINQNGEYRRLSSTTGAGWYRSDTIATLPCGQTFPSGDGAYVYLGGYSTPYQNELEAGLAYDVAGTGMGNHTYTPYVKLAGTSTYYFASNQPIVGSNPWLLTGQIGYSTYYFSCSFENPVWVQMIFDVLGICGDPKYAPPGETSSIEPCQSPTVPFATFTIEALDEYNPNNQLYLGVQFSDYPHNGWTQECPNCVLQAITALAQTTQNFSDGAVFGPVQYAGGQLDGWPNNNVSFGVLTMPYCENHPAWDTANPSTECSNGPPIGAAYSNVQVSGFTYDAQTVTLSNATPTPSPAPSPTHHHH